MVNTVLTEKEQRAIDLTKELKKDVEMYVSVHNNFGDKIHYLHFGHLEVEVDVVDESAFLLNNGLMLKLDNDDNRSSILFNIDDATQLYNFLEDIYYKTGPYAKCMALDFAVIIPTKLVNIVNELIK